MSEEMLNKFGKIIVEAVRDKELNYWDNIFKEKRLYPFLEKYRDYLLNLSPEQLEFLNEVGILVIDSVIHDLLLVLDDKWVTIKLVDEKGIDYNLKELARGGLQGYIFEWAEKYSKYPINKL